MTAVRVEPQEATKLPARTDEAESPLPAVPVVAIRPTQSWVPLRLRELIAYRELLFFLTWRDIKVRYRQTLLGAAWAVVQPLGTMLVFTLFFGTLARMPSDDIPYPLFALAGLVPWTFFANTVISSGNSLVYNADLITKVYFPRLIIPAAAVGLGLVDFAVAFAVLAGLIWWWGTAVTAQLLLLPVLIVLTVLLTLGAGLGLAALNVRFRDVRHALPFCIQLGMFATPIIYPTSLVPERWRWLLLLNPLAGLVEGYRAALFGRPLDAGALAASAAMTLLVLVGSAYVFRHMEKTFADLV